MVRLGAVEVRACGRGPVNVVERRRRRAVPGRALQQRSVSASASATQAHHQHTHDEVKEVLTLSPPPGKGEIAVR